MTPNPTLEGERHSIERTNPKGSPFIGRCTKCGKTDLTFADQDKETCPNPGGVSQNQALLDAIAGAPDE